MPLRTGEDSIHDHDVSFAPSATFGPVDANATLPLSLLKSFTSKAPPLSMMESRPRFSISCPNPTHNQQLGALAAEWQFVAAILHPDYSICGLDYSRLCRTLSIHVSKTCRGASNLISRPGFLSGSGSDCHCMSHAVRLSGRGLNASESNHALRPRIARNIKSGLPSSILEVLTETTSQKLQPHLHRSL